MILIDVEIFDIYISIASWLNGTRAYIWRRGNMRIDCRERVIIHPLPVTAVCSQQLL